MKQFTLIVASSFLLLSGCGAKSEHYVPSAEHEKASISYRNLRTLKNNKSEMFLSAIYLNDVYPKYTDGLAHFIISFYSPSTDNLLVFDINRTTTSDAYSLTLNGEMALKSELLDNDDLLLDLFPIKTKWNKYYYASFELPQGKPTLMLKKLDKTVSLTFVQKNLNKSFTEVQTFGSH